eukprot:3796630-Pyramimonas_sp.AAC.1
MEGHPTARGEPVGTDVPGLVWERVEQTASNALDRNGPAMDRDAGCPNGRGSIAPGGQAFQPGALQQTSQ